MTNKNMKISENEKVKGIDLQNKVPKSRVEGEESENVETTRNNKKERELLEIEKDRRIEVEDRERQQTNKTGTMLQCVA